MAEHRRKRHGHLPRSARLRRRRDLSVMARRQRVGPARTEVRAELRTLARAV